MDAGNSGGLMDEFQLMKDQKYRVYMSNVDKALKNFEYSSEWADLISALGKLNKVISNYPKYQIIPRRIKISKRLAQCMHPALPSGVHLKALESYDVIFQNTGTEMLASELFIYSAGLFPLLGYAAMNVRPNLLGIYEKYFVPLGDRLRPALSGFLSGVLPGYEAGLDYFEQTNSLLEKVTKAVSEVCFYTCLWECVATNASIRLPAVSYILDHFNKKLSLEEQKFFLGRSHDILMSGICACLNDNVILVQRNALEFLLVAFPMHNAYSMNDDDLIRLVTNSLNTILRRDMSLNRRLYSWLLGLEVTNWRKEQEAGEHERMTYFEIYSKKILIKSLKLTLKMSLNFDPVDLRPYKILVSLLDKVEIGPMVLDFVLFDVIRTMALSLNYNGMTTSNLNNSDVNKSANLLFATFDPAYIWNFMTSQFERSAKIARHLHKKRVKVKRVPFEGIKMKIDVDSGLPALVEVCYLTEFLLETISLEMYSETTRIFLPKVFLAIVQMLTVYSEYLNHEDIIAALKLCTKIVSRVQPMISSPTRLQNKNVASLQTIAKETAQKIIAQSQPATNLEKSKSDSRLNKTLDKGKAGLSGGKERQPLEDEGDSGETIKRSMSNQNIKKSPKKSTKKSKSYSRLTEMDNDVDCTSSGQLLVVTNPRELMKRLKKSPIARLKNRKKEEVLVVTIGENCKNIISQENDIAEDGDDDEEEDDEALSVDSDLIPMASAQELTILEQCIRQYEEFFQIYLFRNVLQQSLQPDRRSFSDSKDDKDSDSDNAILDEYSTASIYQVSEGVVILDSLQSERATDIDALFRTLLLEPTENRFSNNLKSLLSRSIIDDNELRLASGDPSSEKPIAAGNIDQLMDVTLYESLRNAIKLATNLLVEMSTFPSYNSWSSSSEKSKDSDEDVPHWLKVLVVCSSYLKSDKDIQINCISTLFELVSLLKSQYEHHSSSPGVTYVVMLPLLKLWHVAELEVKTRVFHLLTSILWDYLTDESGDRFQVTSLLYQLHNSLESGVVETVISHRLANSHLNWQFDCNVIEDDLSRPTAASLTGFEKLQSYSQLRLDKIKILCPPPVRSMAMCNEFLNDRESIMLKKFELLWHLGRDRATKGFDNIVLQMFDVLALPGYVSVRSFVTKWLQEALVRGDMGRLLQPLLLIVLAPNTKRIGVVHAHLLKKGESCNSSDIWYNPENASQGGSGGNGLMDDDLSIIAVSTENGNVSYQTINSGDKSMTRKWNGMYNKKKSPIRTIQKRIFGVSLTGGGGGSNVKSNSSDHLMLDLGGCGGNNASNISVIINPLERSSVGAADDERWSSSGRDKPGMGDLGSVEVLGEVMGKQLSRSAPTKSMERHLLIDESDYFDCEDGDDEEDEDLEEVGDMNLLKNSSDEDNEFTEYGGDEEGETSSNNINNSFEADENSCFSIDENATITDQSSNEFVEFRAKSVAGDRDHETTLSNRFVGHCNHISDVMIEHDRTRNNKTYSLTTPENVVEVLDLGGETIAVEKVNKKAAAKEKTTAKKTKSDKKMKGKNKKHYSGVSKTSTDSNESQERQHMVGATSRLHGDEHAAKDLNDSLDDCNVFLGTKINYERSKKNVEILRENNKKKRKFYDKVHPLHSHILLYYGVFDTKRVLYSLQTLKNLIVNEPRTFLCLSMTTGISDSVVKSLLIRHRKSVFGKGFDGVIANTEFSHAYRGCMFLEGLITICLYYSRSYFQKTVYNIQPMNQLPSGDDVRENSKIQLASVGLLTVLCNELISIVKEMGKGFASYVADLISKCKLQKIVLHSVLTSVYAFNQRDDITFTDEVLLFNDPGDDRLHFESLQIELLKLLLAVIKLEYEVIVIQKGGDLNINQNSSNSSTTVHGDLNSGGSQSPTRAAPNTSSTNIKYLNNCPISQQPMFLSAVLNALQADHLRHLHKNWTDIVIASLNCFIFGSLTNIVISVIHQICNNLDKITMLRGVRETKLPPDYTLTQLEALTVLVHYCLLDNTQQMTLSHVFNQAFPASSSTGILSVPSSNQLLNNLVHVFLSTSFSSEPQTRSAMHMAARNAVLSHLPRIVSSVAALYDNEIGQGRLVNKQLLEFLSPISLHHGVNFLAAVAVVWQERKDNYRKQGNRESEEKIGKKQPVTEACAEQLSLVKLVSGIRLMPMDSFVQTLQQVVKQPPAIHHPPPGLSLDVSALELFYYYMKSTNESQLIDSWPSLLALLKDGLALSPPAQFVMLAILNDFVQRSPQMPFQDKKDIRDLHDITSRLVEAISNVAGACLEQTTWLRRNLAVKEDSMHQVVAGLLKDSQLIGNEQYSVQAQTVLGSILANLLDIAYGSQEKDKVVTIVTTLMYNITPYLKNHTVRNIPSFLACSSLLASLSTYQYTRKAWRKDVIDLLLDSTFFQIDISCLPYWKSILDSLMTCDNTTFRELMSRVSLTQTGSLNIFTSKEQEYEQRAALLKRLAFIIFCSEFDQYHKYMPEIQEQLANSLRLPQVVPSVQAAVLLCFRVLLLRMSPDHVTSLWPIIIAEMVQVLLSMEQELKVDSEEFSQHIKVLSGLNSQWVTNTNNGLHSNGHPQWRMVQLETAKLLELGCVLPATNLPHFQMYRWAFVGGLNDDYQQNNLENGYGNSIQSFFVPHVTRIARLMDLRFTSHSPRPESQRRGKHLSLGCQSIQSLHDLYGFFSTLSITWPPYQFTDIDKEVSSCLAEIESVLSLDFLEKMPQSLAATPSPSSVSLAPTSNGLSSPLSTSTTGQMNSAATISSITYNHSSSSGSSSINSSNNNIR